MIAEYIDLLTFVFCIFSILVLWKLFGLYGLYAYNLLATITSNIQVLKIAQYHYICDSMALGTIVFSTIFIVDVIIVEQHGTSQAKLGLFINFTAYLVFITFMYLSMLYQSAPETLTAAYAMKTLFTQSASIFISSICAYFVSQVFDIYFYTLIRKITFGKFLWVRYNLSVALSMFLDQLIFSILCWKVLNVADLSIEYIISRYIIFNYCIRAAITISATPIIYFARKIRPLKI